MCRVSTGVELTNTKTKEGNQVTDAHMVITTGLSAALVYQGQ